MKAFGLLKRTSRRTKLVCLGVVVLVLVLAVFWVWHSLTTPAKGTIKTTVESPHTKQQLPEYTAIDNEYFSLNYSERFIAQPAQASGEEALRYNFAAKTGDLSTKPTEFLSIVLRPTASGGITLDKGYKNYFLDSKDYKYTNKFYQGEAIDIAIKQSGGTDQVALWLHGQYVLSINLKKDRDQKNLDAELKDILTSVQWKTN